ncbi:MAG: C39 family peptidase [Candidatus Aminicenantes bacterium]|nr:C39 family peptidase [Candidatus Aminicenantes bacterium]
MKVKEIKKRYLERIGFSYKKSKTLWNFIIACIFIALVVIIVSSRCLFLGFISIPPKGGMKFERFHFSLEPIYLQGVRRWRSDRIGGSNEEFRFVGCTVTCVSMALAHYDIDIAPGKLNKLLVQNNSYTKKGWLIWDKVSEVLTGRIKIEVPCFPTYSRIDRSLKSGIPVLVKVMLRKSVPHWVLIVGKDNREYLIKDPLGDGKSIEKLSKYNSNIYSIRLIEKQ